MGKQELIKIYEVQVHSLQLKHLWMEHKWETNNALMLYSIL